MPVGSELCSQRLVRLYRRADGELLEEPLEAVAFVPLIGAEGWPEPGREQRAAQRSASG
jgi:hypothetical protein